MYKLFFKRFFDIIFSLIGLVLLSPIFIILIVCSYIFIGKKIFFIQQRPGKDEKLFKLIKFRTFKFNKVGDAQKINNYGKFLRKSSLDEIPELINILLGDLSFVGPRPLLKEYLINYNTNQKMRHTVRPGLTGLAQINGRSKLSLNEKILWDLKYIEKISFSTDLKIIIISVFKVIFLKDT